MWSGNVGGGTGRIQALAQVCRKKKRKEELELEDGILKKTAPAGGNRVWCGGMVQGAGLTTGIVCDIVNEMHNIPKYPVGKGGRGGYEGSRNALRMWDVLEYCTVCEIRGDAMSAPAKASTVAATPSCAAILQEPAFSLRYTPTDTDSMPPSPSPGGTMLESQSFKDKSTREDGEHKNEREEVAEAASDVEDDESEGGDEEGPPDASSSSTNPLDLKAKEREARFKALRARAVCPPALNFLPPPPLPTNSPINLRSRKTLPHPTSKRSSPNAGANPPTPAPSPAYSASALKLNSNLPNLRSSSPGVTSSANVPGTGPPKSPLCGTRNSLKNPTTATMSPSRTTLRPPGSSTRNNSERWARRI